MITRQEQRDQDYLEGYGVGLSRTLAHQELTGHTIAFVRGYRDAVSDREVAKAGEPEPGPPVDGREVDRAPEGEPHFWIHLGALGIGVEHDGCRCPIGKDHAGPRPTPGSARSGMSSVHTI